MKPSTAKHTSTHSIPPAMPRRVQRTRHEGGGMPPGARYVGRGRGDYGRWGNPWKVVYRPDTGGYHIVHDTTGGEGIGTYTTRQAATQAAVSAYRTWLRAPEQADYRATARTLLAGRDLACWCPLPGPGEPDHCHGAVLLGLANEPDHQRTKR